MEKPATLSREEIERTKKYSIKDGSAFYVMYGFGEQYVTPYAIRLGATNAEIGILGSVPAFIGALFQVIGAKITDHVKDRKKIVAWFVFLQAAMLLPLFIVPFFTKSILLLTALFALYMIFGNMAGPAWASWMGAVVPDNERAAYFSKRNKDTFLFLFISILVAGMILNFFEGINIWIGFLVLFTIAAGGRLVSWYYLTRQDEPQYHVTPQSRVSFKEFLTTMRQTNFGNFVLFRSLLSFAVMIASPFFAVYVLRNLEFSYIQYTAIVLTPIIAKVITMTYWGKYAERFGNKHIMIVSAYLIALIPLWWFLSGMFAPREHIFYLLIIAEFISGFAWAGFELTTFNYMLETTSADKRAQFFAYFNVIFGIAILFGGLLGAYLVTHLSDIVFATVTIPVMLAIFLISTIVRGAVPLVFMRTMNEIRVSHRVDERRLFFDAVIAKPVHATLHATVHTLTLAEKTVETIGRPFRPVFDEVVETLDTGLEYLEPVRRNIEPLPLKKYKRRMRQQILKHTHAHLKRLKKHSKTKRATRNIRKKNKT